MVHCDAFFGEDQAKETGEAVTRLIRARDEHASAWMDVFHAAPLSHMHPEDEGADLVAMLETFLNEDRLAQEQPLKALPAPARGAADG